MDVDIEMDMDRRRGGSIGGEVAQSGGEVAQ
jgi:hypothetical protein